jgi:hypothetical protein
MEAAATGNKKATAMGGFDSNRRKIPKFVGNFTI